MNVRSKNKIKIRLTEERISHIITNHPEMEDFTSEIPNVISDPDFLFQGEKDEYISVTGRKSFFLVIVYKEEKEDGFVITAFKTKSIKYLQKRKILWKKD